MSARFLFTGPDDASTTLLLAHGSGAPMDSPAMNAAATALAAEGLRVARFEFSYMAARRNDGSRRPPPKAETLKPEFLDAIAELAAKGPLIIGGKSMGGRVASMVADDLFAEHRITGLLCLGYPFHPPEKPAQLRTAHLMDLKTPTLICQGTRDPFGTKDEVPGYRLPDTIRVLWLEDGDHDLKPRKSLSGFSTADHLATMAKTVKAWTETLG
jgi:predicted alpha/beta-hydrolase family hydrolase